MKLFRALLPLALIYTFVIMAHHAVAKATDATDNYTPEDDSSFEEQIEKMQSDITDEGQDKNPDGNNVVEINIDEPKTANYEEESEAFADANANEQSEKPIELAEVTLQILNKNSVRVQKVKTKINCPVTFERIKAVVKKAFISPPGEPLCITAYLEIHEINPESNEKDLDQKLLFSGWMFSSSPSLKTLDHPIYDIKLEDWID